MKKYKVLSVRQPYASLLVAGLKDVENRSRATNYRGTVLIHASLQDHDILKWAKIGALSEREQRIMKEAEDAPYIGFRGAIIGSVDIVDCTDCNTLSEWAEPGCWHWIVRNAKVLKTPILDVKGKLGIWEWGGDILE